MRHRSPTLVAILRLTFFTLLSAACASPTARPSPTVLPLFPTMLPTRTPSPSPTPIPALSDSVALQKIADFHSKILKNDRPLEVFLPPGYDPAGPRRYSTLYANDGQDMPLVGMQKTLTTLYDAGEIEPIIVVAVFATDDRLNEYGTASPADYAGRGALAADYTRFILEELMPYIDSRYLTLSGPVHTAIMGWSLGGLSAFDIAWSHPDRFGAVGVFSGSFWWHTDNTDAASRQSSRIAHRLVRESESPPALRFWFEAGTLDETDDRDGNGVIDAIQDTTELMDELTLKGYAEGADMVYVQAEGGQHNQGTWGKVLPEFLKWAFPN